MRLNLDMEGILICVFFLWVFFLSCSSSDAAQSYAIVHISYFCS